MSRKQVEKRCQLYILLLLILRFLQHFLILVRRLFVHCLCLLRLSLLIPEKRSEGFDHGGRCSIVYNSIV